MSKRVKNISKPIENIVLYLNTEVNCTKKVINSKNVEFQFNNMSPIVLNEYCVMKLVSISHYAPNHANHGDNILQFRLGNNVNYNPDLYRSNDNGLPILWASTWTTNEPSFWYSELGGIHLPPQTINNITLVVSDSMTNTYAGVDTSLQFIIGVVFIPYDREYSAIEN